MTVAKGNEYDDRNTKKDCVSLRTSKNCYTFAKTHFAEMSCGGSKRNIP